MRMSVITRSLRSRWPRGLTVGQVIAAAGVLSAACDSPSAPRVLATITVTPNPDTLAINGTQQFRLRWDVTNASKVCSGFQPSVSCQRETSPESMTASYDVAIPFACRCRIHSHPR